MAVSMAIYVDDELYTVLPPTVTLGEAIRMIKKLQDENPDKDVHLEVSE